jgi:hypothetical protein
MAAPLPIGIAYSWVHGVWLLRGPLTWVAAGGRGPIVGAGLAVSRPRATTLSTTARYTIQPPSDT